MLLWCIGIAEKKEEKNMATHEDIKFAQNHIIQVRELLSSLQKGAFEDDDFHGSSIKENITMEEGKRIACSWAERLYDLINSSLFIAVESLDRAENILEGIESGRSENHVA